MARPFLSIIFAALLSLAAGSSCDADNCLRALRATQIPGRLGAAQSFCASFTQEIITATAAIPTYALAGCTGNVASRVSSACSCIATSSSPPPPSTTSSVTSATSSAPSSCPTSGFSTGPKECFDPQLSCSNTTAIADTCCFNAPGGQLLVTSFWDTNPSTGPADSWTIHGLWPDHCDGTFDQFCDPAREYTNISSIISSYGKTDLLTYMNKYWKDYQGNDESFWEHEWNKHGTCISTLEPSCYNGYTAQEEVVDFFEKAVELFDGLDSYNVLADAGIVPSNSVTYTYDQIQSAIKAVHGYEITIQCASGQLDELWYHFNVRGSIQTGAFIPTSPDGSKSSCPTTGIQYLPKYENSTSPTTTIASSVSSPIASSTAAPYSGKGYLKGYTSGASKGCLISAGTWYISGTCATYSAASTALGFTLNSSKGPCGVSNSTFTCATGITAATFTSISGLLAYDGQTVFHAESVPAGSVQQKVYTSANTVDVTFQWQGL